MREIDYFNFRIIDISDGNQIIDMGLRTPYESLEPLQMIEYTEMEGQIALMKRMAARKKAEEERERKGSKGFLWRVACFCGLA